MKKGLILALVAGVLTMGWSATAQAAALPMETTVTAATKFEIMRDNRVSGTVKLAPGAKLEVIELSGGYVVGRFRSLAGRVAAADTDLAALAASMPQEAPAAVAPVATAASAPAAAKAGTKAAPAAAAAAASAEPAATGPVAPFGRTLGSKLVRLENGSLKPHDQARLAGVKFFALYYSASWCGPCRQFTPELVDAYQKIRAQYPEFELVFVSNDRSANDMAGYMRDDHMAWPALRYEAIRGSGDVTRYAGSGIPCLVLVDENGKVLSDSFRGGDYVGPDLVLDDTWKILRDYRRQGAKKKT